jgi:hypothetical protein
MGTDMLIVVKIFLVALAVFGQAKLFPERIAANTHETRNEESLDSLVLPADKPELALAQRALQAQGICPAAKKRPSLPASALANPFTEDSAQGTEPSQAAYGLATTCF